MIRDGVTEGTNETPAINTFANADLIRTAIIGIGSPHAGDDLGWRVIDRLADNSSILLLRQRGLELFKLDRPGPGLAESIRPYDHVLIIDAIKPGTSGPSLICLDAGQLLSTSKQISSHQAGLIETISLLSALQLLPAQLVVAGVSSTDDDVIDRIVTMF
ncbi:MAG: hydrogenase maturation protease [Gammaproteobacteria bacterium]|nr:hydrogenase maturation protease [Gammaproteobacteria bacterium]